MKGDRFIHALHNFLPLKHAALQHQIITKHLAHKPWPVWALLVWYLFWQRYSWLFVLLKFSPQLNTVHSTSITLSVFQVKSVLLSDLLTIASEENMLAACFSKTYLAVWESKDTFPDKSGLSTNQRSACVLGMNTGHTRIQYFNSRDLPLIAALKLEKVKLASLCTDV